MSCGHSVLCIYVFWLPVIYYRRKQYFCSLIFCKLLLFYNVWKVLDNKNNLKFSNSDYRYITFLQQSPTLTNNPWHTPTVLDTHQQSQTHTNSLTHTYNPRHRKKPDIKYYEYYDNEPLAISIHKFLEPSKTTLANIRGEKTQKAWIVSLCWIDPGKNKWTAFWETNKKWSI